MNTIEYNKICAEIDCILSELGPDFNDDARALNGCSTCLMNLMNITKSITPKAIPTSRSALKHSYL